MDNTIKQTKETNKINDSKPGKKASCSVMSHEEVVYIIQGIKELEERYGAFEIVEIEESEELIEVEHDELEDVKQLEPEPELKKPKRFKIFSVDVKSESDILAKRAEKSATFKVRFDEQGNLVNLDFKKPKPKKVKESKPGKLSKLKKLKPSRKGKKGKEEATAEEGKTEEKKSKGGKLKGKFGKIGKLKKAIPGKKSKTEKPEKKE